VKYITYKDFAGALRSLFQSGGNYQKAAMKVQAIVGRTNLGDDPFLGIKLTNHGETRIPHCVKYDLEGSCRLITVQDNGCCAFVFVGKHDECDHWLEKNQGFRLTGTDKKQITSAFKSIDISRAETRIASESDLSNGPLFAKLGNRYYDRIAKGVPRTVLLAFEKLESISTEDEILGLAYEMDDPDRNDVFYDVFSLLRKGDVLEAKKRIDLFTNQAQLVETLPPLRIQELEVGENFIDLHDFEPEIIDHFMRSASFHQWMLFMHPEQKSIVEKDFNGPARLSGVSGSGKTCVVVKRALYLAQKYPGEQILVLTLNKSLARLIDDLINYACHKQRENIVVRSFWQMCQDELRRFEPDNTKLYDELTWKTNEDVSEIWDEFYHCRENNDDAAVLFPVHQSLLLRQIFPKDYLKQEFDYIRSALALDLRHEYLSLEREGRSEPFDKRFREMILAGLSAWEEKMRFVGVIDYLGLSAALHKYLKRIEPRYRCVLVDEVQDFGTIELEIIRKFAQERENDIFLCGDVAQQVYTKHHKPSSAGLNITGRSSTIRRNYRNSHEILAAAHRVLSTNLTEGIKKNKDFEILEPEYANFSTPKPLLLRAESVSEEFTSAYNYFSAIQSEDARHKSCIALCGYSLKDVKEIGYALGLQVLDGTTNIDESSLFLSDLEQSKGFEFDSMCIVNCNDTVIPDPNLPGDEWYRELFKLYVAMTRAKRELIISYSQRMSSFIEKCVDSFVQANWSEHSTDQTIPQFILSSSTTKNYEEFYQNQRCVELTGKEFLYTKRAVGLSIELQNKLVEHITGIDKASDKKQVEWRNIRHALEFRTQDRLMFLFGREAYQRFIELF
jgi:UvrD/REP helicase N-terminal domain/UvrD-like helicase C-terminal domain